jgi:hypothetical protein
VWVTLCTKQWKLWLQKNMKMLLNCFASYKQSDWPKYIFIISLYIHDIRSFTCDPYRVSERSDFNQIAVNLNIWGEYRVRTFITGPNVRLVVTLVVTLVNHIGGVMGCVFASKAVHRVFEPRSGQTKDYKIGLCCFSTISKHWSSIEEKEQRLVDSESV